jgi:predicted ATPase
MTLDRWDDTAKVTYNRALWNELCSLRFVESGHNAVIMGPVGAGKTFLVTALGHAAIHRRYTVHFERCDRLLKRLRASRLDNSHDVEMRKLLRVDLLIVDDFALQPLDPLDTADVYELIVERHRAAATVVTSNREPIEWLGLMADPLLTQSAIDQLQSAAYELVLDGDSYRQRQKPTPTQPSDNPLDLATPPRQSSRRRRSQPARWSHPTGARVVPSGWRSTVRTSARAAARPQARNAEGTTTLPKRCHPFAVLDGLPIGTETRVL